MREAATGADSVRAVAERHANEAREGQVPHHVVRVRAVLIEQQRADLGCVQRPARFVNLQQCMGGRITPQHGGAGVGPGAVHADGGAQRLAVLRVDGVEDFHQDFVKLQRAPRR